MDSNRMLAVLMVGLAGVAGNAAAQERVGAGGVKPTAGIEAPARTAESLNFQRSPRQDSVLAGGSFGNLPSWSGTVPGPCEINPELTGCGGTTEDPVTPPSGGGTGGGTPLPEEPAPTPEDPAPTPEVPPPDGSGEGGGGLAPAFGVSGSCGFGAGGARVSTPIRKMGNSCSQSGYYTASPGAVVQVNAWFSLSITTSAPLSEFSVAWSGDCTGGGASCETPAQPSDPYQPGALRFSATATVTHVPSGAQKTMASSATWSVCGVGSGASCL